MQDQTVLITGANSGLGRVTAGHLAGRGAQVLILCRNRDKAEATREAIVRATGNPRVFAYHADLASQRQTRQVAAQILEKNPRLHVLINNAGLLTARRLLTEEGLEMTFAVNHLACFLLTRLLLDRIIQSAPARIINVSSMVHRWGRMRFRDWSMKRFFLPMAAYAQSKLANVLFTYALARRLEGTGVTVNCLHPGVVDSGFGREGSRLYRFLKTLARPFFYISPERGAQTQIYLATSPDVASVSGAYFVNQKPVRSSRASYDREQQERLWRLSETLTGLPAWPPPSDHE